MITVAGIGIHMAIWKFCTSNLSQSSVLWRCLERGADLHMAQLMPLPLTFSCFCKIHIRFTFWYRLTRVVQNKGPLSGCVCVISHNHCGVCMGVALDGGWSLISTVASLSIGEPRSLCGVSVACSQVQRGIRGTMQRPLCRPRTSRPSAWRASASTQRHYWPCALARSVHWLLYQ